MRREWFVSGTEWESKVGYSRAVRIGDRVLVSGTTATVTRDDPREPERGEGRVPAAGDGEDDGIRIAGEGDPYKQARQAMENVVAALEDAGATARDVVRTRIYVTDIGTWDDVGRAHAEIFGHAAPATTMVEVNRLIDERMLVEVEAEAVLDH